MFSVLWFWVSRLPWQIILLVWLTPNSGILRYWYVIMTNDVLCICVELLNIVWLPHWYLLFFLLLFMQLHQSRILNWTSITMRPGWCTLVGRGWYLIKFSFIFLLFLASLIWLVIYQMAILTHAISWCDI